jgi:hypothetical protein
MNLHDYFFFSYTDKFGDTLVADNGFALLWPKPEDHLFEFKQEVFKIFFAVDRSVHGKIVVDNIQKPPSTASCQIHPKDLVFRDAHDDWMCLGHEQGIACDICVTWGIYVNVVHDQQTERVLVPEQLAPLLFDGMRLHEYETNFQRYSAILTKRRYAVLRVKDGVVLAIQHGPSDVPTMD